MYFLEKLLGLGVGDGVKVNTVFTRLCWLMGVWPAVYASLLLPTAKSGNKVCTATMFPHLRQMYMQSQNTCVLHDPVFVESGEFAVVSDTDMTKHNCRYPHGLL